jgi:hypothetical protein
MTRARHGRRQALWVLAWTALAVAAGLWVTARAVRTAVRQEVEVKVNAQPSPALEETRREEEARLGGLTWVDRDAGVVSRPLHHAREAVLRDWASRPGGLVPIPAGGPSATSQDGGAP